MLVGKTGTGTVTVKNAGGDASTLWGTVPAASGKYASTALAFGPLSQTQTASQSFTLHTDRPRAGSDDDHRYPAWPEIWPSLSLAKA